MTIKSILRSFCIITLFTILWNQQANILSQKIAIENSYQQKLSSAVSRMLGQEQFLAIVSIEFSTIGTGTLKKAESNKTDANPAMGYIPGLPTVPSTQNTQLNPNRSKNNTNLPQNSLEIGRVDVTIGLDDNSINGAVKQEIKSLVEKIIPQTKDCDDCIKIESMQFQSNKKNDKLDELEAKIEELEQSKREADLARDAMQLTNLEKQLDEAQSRRKELETIESLSRIQRIKEDSIRFSQLIASEKARKLQDSLKFVNTEKRLERVMESKLKSDSVIIHETLSIVKQQAGGSGDDESLLGMQVGGKSNIMSSIIFILLIIALMVVTFLAANNKKPKTVYLKPKGQDNKKESKKNKKAKSEPKAEPEIEKESEPKSEPVAAKAPKPDEDAMRSELKHLRQTAVSLTVGEKEGASALIKEWLDDNPNKSDGEEGEGEEGE